MAKTPKVKKREVSLHSRAARRGSPPAKEVAGNGSVEESDYKPWLHNTQNAGISKKRKTKQLTRQQKVRQQRGLEKADTTAAKLEKKVEESKNRGRKVNARRIDWEELNEKIVGSIPAGKDVKKVTQVESVSNDIDTDGQTGEMQDVDVVDSAAVAPVQSLDGTAGIDGSTTLSTIEAIQRFNGTAPIEEEADEIT